jgi:hypothetical protein
VQDIREGRFDDAGATLTAAAAQEAERVRQDALLREGLKRVVDATPHGRYLAAPAFERVSRAHQEGKITDASGALSVFEDAMRDELQSFNSSVRPSVQDDATANYFAERRSRERAAKGLL